MLPLLGAPWLVVAALLLLAVPALRLVTLRSGETRVVAAIVVAATALRFWFGYWGPLHNNAQGPLWVRGAIDPTALGDYGPGYFELFHWVVGLGVAPDIAVFAANAVVSGLTPALLYAAVRLLGLGQGGALFAALVLAAEPVSVRSAASEGYFVSIIALTVAVQVALGLAVRATVCGDRAASGLALLSAGLLAAAAARVHPMGYVAIALCPLVAMCAAVPTRWRSRVVLAAVAFAAVGLTVLLVSGAIVVTSLRESRFAVGVVAGASIRGHLFWLGALAAGAAVYGWRTSVWLPFVGLASLGALASTQQSFQQSPLWAQCYRNVYLPGLLIGAAALLPRRTHLGWASAAVAVALGVAFLRAPAGLSGQTTDQMEYDFLRDVLRAAPPGCTLAAVRRSGDRTWEIPGYLLPGSAVGSESAYREVRKPNDLMPMHADDCLLYVHSSLCSSAEGQTACDTVERGVAVTPLASRVFPAVPSFVYLPYDRDAIEVIVSRVDGRAASAPTSADAGEPVPITPAVAEAIHARLSRLQEADGCRLGRFDTEQFRIRAELADRAGTVHGFELATGQGAAGTRRAGIWNLSASPEIERACGATLAAIERVLAGADPSAARL